MKTRAFIRKQAVHRQFEHLFYKLYQRAVGEFPAFHGVGTFANNYGVSVVRNDYTYGNDQSLYELAVLGQDGHLAYDTPITSDVCSYCTRRDISALMTLVRALPAKRKNR